MKLFEDVPLAPRCTLEVGGSARFFVEATREEAVVEAAAWAARRGIELHVLGGGANLVIADEGIDVLAVATDTSLEADVEALAEATIERFGGVHVVCNNAGVGSRGLKVADLLDVLRITKQSLGRVLKQLLDEGYIVQKTGNNDRRQRLLYATPKGEALVGKLAGLQTDRINRAVADIGPAGTETVRQFLRAMIDRDDPDKVLQTIFAPGAKG